MTSLPRTYSLIESTGRLSGLRDDTRQTLLHTRHANTACGAVCALNESGFVSLDEHFGHRVSDDSVSVMRLPFII